MLRDVSDHGRAVEVEPRLGLQNGDEGDGSRAVARERGRNVAIVWFTVQDDMGHAFAAFSADSGRTFGEPVRMDEASALGRVDIELLPDGYAVATWIEFAEERSQFTARRVHPSGRKSDLVTVASIEGARASGYPRIARSDDELVFAWTESKDGKLRVRTAVTRVATATTE